MKDFKLNGGDPNGFMGNTSMWEVKEEEMTKKLREQDIWLYNQQVELKPAIERVIKELREDEDYYRAFKDNIAMAFYDEICNNLFTYTDETNWGEVANKGADNFLKLLISK